MRFAYIDSQGNEVSIPSVDALALRIELGAIGPDTELYDAQADRWGPAQTHEIFHTLSRDVGGAEGFIAPPPPVAPPPPQPPPPPPPAGPPPHLRDEFMPMEEPAPEPAAPEPELPAFDFSAPPAPESAEGEGMDFTLAPPPGQAPQADLSLAFDLAPAASPEPPRKEKKEEEEEPVSFDFGGGLELAPEPFSAPEPSAAPGAAADAGHGMELEQPMSAFTPDAAPAWMREEEPAAKTAPAPDDGAMDLGRRGAEESAPRPRRGAAAAAAAAAEGEAPAEARERPQPRNRPSPPKRTRSRSLTPVILAVVGLGVVGGGGFFGWKAFQGRKAAAAVEETTPALPAVVIPSIPVELLPQMRDLGELALSDMMAELGGVPAELGIPAEPNRDWLAGVYLANASQFGDVKAFWDGIDAFVDRVRDSDTRVFHERYQARLEEAAVASDTAAILLERADSGFLSTRDQRFEAYALMDDLVNAALDLHEFLLANEAKIEYAPAAGGVSRDPVLEAVPETKELGEEMWNRVDRITAALDAMGTLDKVTTERLTAVLFDRIRRASFQ